MDPISITTNTKNTINYITPILLLMSVAFMFIFSSSITSYDQDYETIPINYYINKPKEQETTKEQNEYNQKIQQNKGTIQLVKGFAKVIHHNIKQDSIILLSRKSVEGKPGTHLIVDHIESNQYFTVKSIDNDNNVTESDLGVIYYKIF